MVITRNERGISFTFEFRYTNEIATAVDMLGHFAKIAETPEAKEAFESAQETVLNLVGQRGTLQ